MRGTVIIGIILLGLYGTQGVAIPDIPATPCAFNKTSGELVGFDKCLNPLNEIPDERDDLMVCECQADPPRECTVTEVAAAEESASLIYACKEPLVDYLEVEQGLLSVMSDDGAAGVAAEVEEGEE